MTMKLTLLIVTFAFIYRYQVLSTVDLNLEELKFLSNHLEPEECRKLVAAAHFKSYSEPNALGEAENKISKDISCLDLLLHWNSADGEGRGETHEVLEHRLRQMGKIELADWLGKTVFHQLGKDLEEALEIGLNETANDTITFKTPTRGPPNIFLQEQVKVVEDPSEWSPFDTIFYSIGLELFFAIICIIIAGIFLCLLQICKRRAKSRSVEDYELVEQNEGEKGHTYKSPEHEVETGL